MKPVVDCQVLMTEAYFETSATCECGAKVDLRVQMITDGEGTVAFAETVLYEDFYRGEVVLNAMPFQRACPECSQHYLTIAETREMKFARLWIEERSKRQLAECFEEM